MNDPLLSRFLNALIYRFFTSNEQPGEQLGESKFVRFWIIAMATGLLLILLFRMM